MCIAELYEGLKAALSVTLKTDSFPVARYREVRGKAPCPAIRTFRGKHRVWWALASKQH